MQIGLKCDYTLSKHNKEVTEVKDTAQQFSRIQMPKAGSVNIWGFLQPKTPGCAIPGEGMVLARDNPMAARSLPLLS